MAQHVRADTSSRWYHMHPSTQGWGAAVATCLLALGLLFGAYSIHKATYQSPNEVLGPASGTNAAH